MKAPRVIEKFSAIEVFTQFAASLHGALAARISFWRI